jgi:glycerol-3-phosphate O-acyltransferase / dihydroxyacetone phosphate acyltransferase
MADGEGVSAFIRVFALALVRFFYRRIRIVGSEKLPTSGPAIVVANHPNGLIDPMIVNMAIPHRVAFLAKSTLFKTWIGKHAMAAFDAIPVYRAKEADTKQNDAMFEACRAHLGKNKWMALFPEGVSHSAPHLQPLKTGAARIALQTEEPALMIVPVGLTYDDKAVFRSAVTATIGTPLSLASFLAEKDARALTRTIEEALRDVVLEADDETLWNGFRFAARWTKTGDDIESTARRYAETYRALAASQPERAAELVDDVRDFANLLGAVGIKDPFELAARPRGVSTFFGLLLLPVALLGAAFAWLPYRAVKPLSEKLAHGETDLISTIKVLLGALVLTVVYLAWGIGVGLWLGGLAGIFTFILAPTTGYVALRFGEWLDKRRRLLGGVMKRVDTAVIREAQAQLSEKLERTLSAG